MLITAVLVHAVLAIEGTALQSHLTALQQLRRWAGVPELLTAMVGGLILACIALLAARVVRAMLPYEVWHHLHLTSYAVLALAYAHEYVGGSDIAASTRVRTIWTVLYGLTVAGLIWGRVVVPIRLNQRHRLRVAQVRSEGPEAFSIYVTGRWLDRLPAEAGQFLRWRFVAAGRWWQSHPFSLPPGAVIIYRARSRRDVIFDRELAQLSEERSARVFYVLGRRDDPGPASAMTAPGLRHLVPDLVRRDVFLCCSEGLTQEVLAVLGALRVPRRQVHIGPSAF